MNEFERNQFAGFWNRLIALIIDVIVVSFIVFPFALIIGLVSPNAILVEVPFDLFTTTTVISENPEIKESIEKDEVLGLWSNLYKVTETTTDGETSTTRTLIDTATKLRIEKTTSSDIEFYIIFIGYF